MVSRQQGGIPPDAEKTMYVRAPLCVDTCGKTIIGPTFGLRRRSQQKRNSSHKTRRAQWSWHTTHARLCFVKARRLLGETCSRLNKRAHREDVHVDAIPFLNACPEDLRGYVAGGPAPTRALRVFEQSGRQQRTAQERHKIEAK